MDKKRPNILFLFSDQQRWDTVSCYGQPLGSFFQLTPVLDQLAREGTRFDGAMTCQPVCGPARACIQTGKYPSQIGCQTNDRILPASEKGIAQYLREAGYETAYVGKWHLGSNRSFADPPYPDSVDNKTRPVPAPLRGGYDDYWAAADILEFTSHGYGGFVYGENGEKRTFSGYRADAVTDFALEYLARPKEKPFFLFVSYVEPHHQNDRQRFEGPYGSKERFRNFPVPGDLAGTEGDWREQMPDYLGCCARLDENVGRLIEALKQNGQYDDTVIFYTSDHGSHFCTRNSEYKRSCHDDSIHVPFLAKGREFDGGRVVSELTSLIDIAPTILYAAGIPKPGDMPGFPLQTLLMQPGKEIHDGIFIQISESCVGRALRTREYTYCVEVPIQPADQERFSRMLWTGEWEGNPMACASPSFYREAYLYDLKRDPFQRENQIRSFSYRRVREKLRRQMEEQIRSFEGHPVKIEPALN